MDPEASLYAIGIVLCLVLLAFTSAVDAALSAISRHRLNALQDEGTRRAKIVTRLLNDPYRFKAAILLLNAAAIIVATTWVLHLTAGLANGWRAGALAVLLLFLVIFSEALPKAIVMRDPARAAYMLSGPMALIAAIMWPIISLIGVVIGPVIRMISGQHSTQLPLVTEEELRLIVNVGEEEGVIEADEREMIEGIFSFGDTVVREVMVPRVDIVALGETASLAEALEIVIAHGHSRIPVYHETIDQIVGILYAKDLLPGLRAGQSGMSLAGLLRQPHYVPETMKVDALLKDLQARKVHLALVVDEYGGTAGLATIEDLLEEIVGDIQDEYDVEEPSVQVIGDGELLADARVLLDDLNDMVGLHLSSDESDRVGGLVFERLGRVPVVGDQVHLDNRVTITVLSVEGLRPRQLQITYQPHGELEVSTAKGEAAHNDEGN